MKKISLLVAGVAALTAASAVQAGTLEDVRAKGFVSVALAKACQASQIRMTRVTGLVLMLICAVLLLPLYLATHLL